MMPIARLLPLAGLFAAACGTPEDPDERVETGAEIAAMTTTDSTATTRAGAETEAGFRTATFAVG